MAKLKHIRYEPDVALKLMTIAAEWHEEFSGFGFGRIEKIDDELDEFVVYDFVLLDIGSPGYTEIPPERVIKLLEREDVDRMKIWIHRHPVGNGEPGPHNWSGTDNQTAEKEPMGSTPELVKWSLAAVLTPRGWVGRFDNHVNHVTTHLPVVPQISVSQEIDTLKPKPLIRPYYSTRWDPLGTYSDPMGMSIGDFFRHKGTYLYDEENFDMVYQVHDIVKEILS